MSKGKHSEAEMIGVKQLEAGRKAADGGACSSSGARASPYASQVHGKETSTAEARAHSRASGTPAPPPPPPPPQPITVTVPEGTIVTIRTIEAIDSASSTIKSFALLSTHRSSSMIASFFPKVSMFA